jgi:hypothetical protein
MASVCLIIALAAYQNLELKQIDVDSAFLNGMIDAEVYMFQPLSYINQEFPNYVWKLIKSIYGLKQAGKIWHAAARLAIFQLGLKATASDTCVFFAF